MDKIDGLRITLISDVYETPYSGMLPGFVENDYSLDDIQIDLYKICYHGNFRFINCKVNNKGNVSTQGLESFVCWLAAIISGFFLLTHVCNLTQSLEAKFPALAKVVRFLSTVFYP